MMNRSRWTWPLILLLSSCAEPEPVTSIGPEQVESVDHTMISEPDLVLDGTDMLSLSEIRLFKLPLSPIGNYRAEAGGSEITVSISGTVDDSWSVIRSYQEPGLPVYTKRYQAQHFGQMLGSPNGGLTIQGTEEGVLVLETNSGIESIPPDFWIHYIRSTKAN